MLLLLSVMILFFSCTQQKQNVLHGKIEGLEVGDKIILSVEDPNSSSWIATDSTIIEKAGEFTLTTKVSGSSVQLTPLKTGEEFNPSDTQAPNTFLEGYANLNVSGDADDWYYTIKVTGGLFDHPDMQEINHLTDSLRFLHKEGAALRKKARETQDEELYSKGEALYRQANQIADIVKSLNNDFVKKHFDMAYSADLLRYNYDIMKDINKYEEAFKAFTPLVQNSPAGILIKNYITNVHASGIGAIAPDFNLKSLDNQNITLSGFREKYILLDFWGSWCGPCRESSPLLVELYNNLKENEANIEFIGIACNEQNDENWIAAVESDKLAWIQLNDAHVKNTQSIQKQYAIKGVPTCVLISPDGKIIYKEHPLKIIPKVKEIFGL